MIWVIGGAGSRVGKTTLATQLSSILPNSIVIKHGHGKFKSHKPKNFCQTKNALEKFIERIQNSKEHIIVESNSLSMADIAIFIDDHHIDRRPDADVLKTAADICLDQQIELETWKSVLTKKLDSLVNLNKILDVFKQHIEYKVNRK